MTQAPAPTHILFVEKFNTEAQPGVEGPWDPKLINPTKEELEIYEYVTSNPDIIICVVNSEHHYSAYDHDDPDLDTDGCICLLEDRTFKVYPKLYTIGGKLLAAGYQDIMSLNITNL